jgi:hypothetical protein
MSTIIMAAIAAAIVLAGVLVYKLLSGNVRGRKGSRLGISEYHELDKTRRLVLVRRDDVEHLLLIGGAHDVVVEGGIGSPLVQNAGAPQMARPAPRPAVFGARRPAQRPVEPMLEAEPIEPR